MIGRRAIAGLLLLSALLFCAIAAQGASAAAHTSINTTAFTCVPNGGAKDFSDAHCDNTVTPGLGSFGHELIPAGETTIEVTNEKTKNATTEHTPSVLKGELLKAKAEITCTKVKSTPDGAEPGKHTYIQNVDEPTNKEHRVTGTVTVDFTECTVQKPAKCTVKEPIVVTASFMGVDELNRGEKNMGLEFTGDGSTTFTEITFQNKGAEECSLKNLAFPVQGTAIGTGTPGGNAKESGATLNFSPEKEMQTLTLGGNKAEFTGVFTTRMTEKDGKVQNPITLTTTT